ncbi:hypothetical protein V6N11_012555 [Hibiscus sabdariffa]|uniref:Uncharacterized protein n=1 Tax=Hibiscus sabdariffa TaxID=183260 RepID=A0ABR2QBH1_9ROSI
MEVLMQPIQKRIQQWSLCLYQLLPTGATTAGPGPGPVPGPTTSLHIGMDNWGTPASSNVPAMHTEVSSTPVAGGIVTPASLDTVQSQLWLQLLSP